MMLSKTVCCSSVVRELACAISSGVSFASGVKRMRTWNAAAGASAATPKYRTLKIRYKRIGDRYRARRPSNCSRERNPGLVSKRSTERKSLPSTSRSSGANSWRDSRRDGFKGATFWPHCAQNEPLRVAPQFGQCVICATDVVIAEKCRLAYTGSWPTIQYVRRVLGLSRCYHALCLRPNHQTNPSVAVFCSFFNTPGVAVRKNGRLDQSRRYSPRARKPSANLYSAVSVDSFKA